MAKTSKTHPAEDEIQARDALQEAWLAGLRDGLPVGHSYGALLGLPPMDVVALDQAARRGLPWSTWERFAATTRLPKPALMDWVQVSSRTLSRRRDEGRLQRDESDRLLRAARIFARAVEIFHADIDAAARWLVTPQLGLGGATPLAFSATDAGAVEVERLAGRLEHGIPA